MADRDLELNDMDAATRHDARGSSDPAEGARPLLGNNAHSDYRHQFKHESDTLEAGWKRYFWPVGLASLTIQVSGASSKAKPRRALSVKTDHLKASPKPPRWRTLEFYVYYVVVAVAIGMMIRAPVQLSQDSHPNYWIFEKRLSEGWMFGRKVDNTDAQFRRFRNGLPSLLALAAVYLACSKIYNLYLSHRLKRTQAPPATPNLTAPYQRIPFILTISMVILVILHGISAFKVLGLLYLNFKLHSFTGNHKITPYIVWILNIAILFCNDIFHGYKFGNMWSALSPLDNDRIAGLVSAWHVSFNISMLRMVSFSLDWYWARTSAEEKASHSLHDYTWQNYLSYVLYPPLYIGGPIITFDSFIHQVKQGNRIPGRAILAYAVRFLACWLTMETILHFMYVVAIKDSWATQKHGHHVVKIRAWDGDTPFELAMISFWNLVIVWLKLLLPWRFFRLWSLMDGIDPPENMIRCVLNNYSTRGFWRSWHRSYNLWLIRYLYIPISSATNAIFATLLIFTFVALWHDISLHLLAWGWLITLFVLPEMLAVKAVPEHKYGHTPWYRHLAAVGALCNIFMMITANTVGFVLGVDNTLLFVKAVFGTGQGVIFLVLAVMALFSASHIMFEYREEELRHNIVRKC